MEAYLPYAPYAIYGVGALAVYQVLMGFVPRTRARWRWHRLWLWITQSIWRWWHHGRRGAVAIKPEGAIGFLAAGRSYTIEWHPEWQGEGLTSTRVGQKEELGRMLMRYRKWDESHRHKAAQWAARMIRQQAERGTLHDYNVTAPQCVQVWLLPFFLDIADGKVYPVGWLDYCDFRGCEDPNLPLVVVYAAPTRFLTTVLFDVMKAAFEVAFGGPVVIEPAIIDGNPLRGAICVRRVLDLAKELRPPKTKGGEFPFGIDRLAGEPITIGYRDFRNVGIQGTQGFGKSELEHQIIRSALACPQARRFKLIDLKGGVEFVRYERMEEGISADKKRCEVIANIPDMVAPLRALVGEMDVRLGLMRKASIEFKRDIVHWADLPANYDIGVMERGDVWIVIDESADLSATWDRDPNKANKAAILEYLDEIGRKGRAAGFRLVMATQKGTADAIPSNITVNLDVKCCFFLPNDAAVRVMLGGTTELPADPYKLAQGEYLAFLDRKMRWMKGFIAAKN